MRLLRPSTVEPYHKDAEEKYNGIVKIALAIERAKREGEGHCGICDWL